MNNKQIKIKSKIKSGQGLGDAIAEFTETTGLDKIADMYESVTGKDCGCDERREHLNSLMPSIL